MIPKRYITEWSGQAPWVVNKFIEQDLTWIHGITLAYVQRICAEYEWEATG